jgi:hypothetical protein
MELSSGQKNMRRGQVIRWLRKAHGWLGLWGAVLGLLFGASGILLNHRAVMKIPAAHMEESEIQLPVPQPQPQSAKEFARFIQQALDIRHEPFQRPPKKEAKQGRSVGFMGKEMAQPATWKVEFQLPQTAIQAEYIPGNQFATIKKEDANVFAFITRMHKGVGMNTGWILLADTIAGALVILAITGVLLWTKMRGSRLALVGLTGTSLLLTILFTLQSM